MKKLTDKEIAIMEVLWNNEPLPMREILEKLPEPHPSFNTIATFVRRLETHGMIKHQELGARFFLYEPTMTKDEYLQMMNKDGVKKFFGGSYLSFISKLVEEKEISIDELKDLIKSVDEED